MTPRFNTIVGTGGIGKGVVYRLAGSHDLGRDESRAGHLLDLRDFCKLHIIFHYISVFLRDSRSGVRVLPVGAVGCDEPGRELLGLMQQAGMDMRFVRALKIAPTLYSICFPYPDGAGGNITENQSASARVSTAMLAPVAPVLRKAGARGLVLAAPEVPLASRLQLLEMGRRAGAFAAASFNSEEIRTTAVQKALKKVDLLAINRDEARALAGAPAKADAHAVVRACARKAMSLNPDMRLVITAGGSGLFGCHAGACEHESVLKVPVVNTAGAGDATLAGLVCGLAIGLPFMGSGPRTAIKLGHLFAAMSVTSADTIHFGFSLKALNKFARKNRQPFWL